MLLCGCVGGCEECCFVGVCEVCFVGGWEGEGVWDFFPECDFASATLGMVFLGDFLCLRF